MRLWSRRWLAAPPRGVVGSSSLNARAAIRDACGGDRVDRGAPRRHRPDPAALPRLPNPNIHEHNPLARLPGRHGDRDLVLAVSHELFRHDPGAVLIG